jgi:hypothetical protein
VDAFLFDDDNEEKFAVHGISGRQVFQVLDNPYVVVPNRQNRRALMLLIGQDNGGVCIAIPIEPTEEPGVWRPITAWPCKRNEQHLLDRL